MRRIALEEHFVMNEPEHIDRWKSLIPTAPKSVTDKILTSLVDVGEGRLEAMAQAGIDLAVLSDAGIVQNVLDATPALRLARESNDYLAKIVQQTPEHYAGFATVPLVDPKAGADEFERAVTQLGFKGALINGQTNGHYLDDDRYSVFWEPGSKLWVYLSICTRPTPLWLRSRMTAVLNSQEQFGAGPPKPLLMLSALSSTAP